MNMETKVAEWKAHILVDGKAAVQDLLGGSFAALGYQAAVEPHEVADRVLGNQDPETGIFDAFDEGCLSLAIDYRDQFVRETQCKSASGLLSLDMFLRVVRRMLPPKTVLDFHRGFDSWNGFFENFVLDSGLDLRREYYRVLSLSQNIATDHGLDPRRLVPLWLSVCAGSGDFGPFDRSNLEAALDGLRLLPRDEKHPASANPELLGLAFWAARQRPGKEEFGLEWRIRKNVYKRAAEFTAEGVRAAVAIAERDLTERTGGEEKTFPLADWWLRDVGVDPVHRKFPRRQGEPEPVTKREWEAVLRKVGESLGKIRPEIEKLMRRQRRYADAAGDFFYLVRIACNFGMRLLETGPETERAGRGRLAASLAAQALGRDQTDICAWSLMRDALAASGRMADAELVGWETIRRFPENVRWRTQLASMLANGAGKSREAESLLRETMELFPADPHARALLATVLADDLHRVEEARDILKEAIVKGVADDATLGLKRKLERGRALRGAGSRPQVVERDGDVLDLPSGAARRQLFLYETGAANEEDMRAFLAELPTDGYAVYLANRVGLSNDPLDTNFALAFEEAIRKAEPSAWRALMARARPSEKAIVLESLEGAVDMKSVNESVLDGTDIDKDVAMDADPVRARSGSLAGIARDARFRALQDALRQRGGREDRRIRLLRDFAASTLSSGSAVSLLAA